MTPYANNMQSLETIYEHASIELKPDNARTHQKRVRQRARHKNASGISSPKHHGKHLCESKKGDSPTADSRWESETVARITVLNSALQTDASIRPKAKVPISDSPTKPTRRQSIDDPELLAQLSDSFSSLENDDSSEE